MQKNWKALLKPTIKRKVLGERYGCFVVSPLDQGMGHTLATALRRVMLSSLQGTAVVGARIKGVEHTFSALGEVFEDVPQILMNLKRLKLWVEGDQEKVAKIKVKGPKTVTAADIENDSGLRVLDPSVHICQLSEGDLEIDLHIRTGKGYVSSEESNNWDLPLGVLPMDAIFSPVKDMVFQVKPTRQGDELRVEVWTNGVLMPDDALALAAKIVQTQMSVFINFHQGDEAEATASLQETVKPSKEVLSKPPYEVLDLSVRATNCLESASIKTIEQLVLLSEQELLKLGFGRKTINELKDSLSEYGLYPGMKF
jgi:DNA-directed RNA polymerase subunit alpha